MTRLVVAGLALTLAGCQSQAPTYGDVAPILDSQCVGCHRAGHAAPFALTSYVEVRAKADLIAAAVRERRMPPWLPEHGKPAFVGERRLAEAQIDTITRWVASGAAEGTPLPRTPTGSNSRWQLGAPDLVVGMSTAFVLDSVGHDVFRNVVLKAESAQRRYVRAVEFDPGSAPIHHAVIRVDRQRLSRTRDGEDGQPGFEGMAAYEVQDPEGHFLGWAPGRGPITSPADMPWVLEPGTDLVVELHLMSGPEPTYVQPSVALYFTNTPPARQPTMIVMGSKAIDIPAGATDYLAEDRYELPVDVEISSIYPHAHYLARTMVVHAELPGGERVQLLNIPRWSFNWQQDYRLQSPIALPRGTAIVQRFTYDNSTGNRTNPHRPPKRVTWGPQSHDEMGNVGLQLLTRTPTDQATLAASFTRHANQIDVKGGEALVRAFPDDPRQLTFLGASYMQAGRYADAVPVLQRSLRLAPESAANENHLGGALMALDRPADAVRHFERAAALSPRDPYLGFNLAKVLAGLGDSRRAVAEYRRVLGLDPSFAEAHHHLGVVLFVAGELPAAVTHLTRAAALSPTSADVYADLGGALAQAGRWDEARRALQRALELEPANATARENLTRLERLRP